MGKHLQFVSMKGGVTRLALRWWKDWRHPFCMPPMFVSIACGNGQPHRYITPLPYRRLLSRVSAGL